MNDSQVAELLQLYFNGSISLEQKEQLADWIQENGYTEQFERLMQQSWQQFQPGQVVADDRSAQWLQHILANAPEAQVVPMATRARAWMRWTAAAAVLIVIGAGILYLLNRNKKPEQKATTTIVKHDVPPPAASTAVLTLANGQRIVLDSAANGSLAMQGAMQVVKLEDGKIAYKGAGGDATIQYNTLMVPAGSRITSITLSDGTSVTLNAASSITYPVAFNGGERKVSITGEVYFEVAHNPAKPFYVEKGNVKVEVIGTHFNMNTYDDESSMKVTLLEGAVHVTSADQKQKIRPGQQAQITSNNIQLVENTDIDATMAWKNGLFLYKGTDIKTIMREVARAYNVAVNYESVSNEKFYVEISRNNNISNLLKMLELTDEVHFKVEGNQVTVLR